MKGTCKGNIYVDSRMGFVSCYHKSKRDGYCGAFGKPEVT